MYAVTVAQVRAVKILEEFEIHNERYDRRSVQYSHMPLWTMRDTLIESVHSDLIDNI